MKMETDNLGGDPQYKLFKTKNMKYSAPSEDRSMTKVVNEEPPLEIKVESIVIEEETSEAVEDGPVHSEELETTVEESSIIDEGLSDSGPLIVNDIVITETSPKLAIEQAACLTATQLYFGNLECTCREISISSGCLKMTPVSPAKVTNGSGKPIKFGITFPMVDIRGFFHYSEFRGPEEGHYLFFLVKKESSGVIMTSFKKTLPGSILFDPDNSQESVRYLFMKCNRNVGMSEILKWFKDVPSVNISRENCMKRYHAIKSNIVSNQIAQNSARRPGVNHFNEHIMCEQGCGLTFPQEEINSHKCIEALKKVNARLKSENENLKRVSKRTHDGKHKTDQNSSPSAGYSAGSKEAGINDLVQCHLLLTRFLSKNNH